MRGAGGDGGGRGREGLSSGRDRLRPLLGSFLADLFAGLQRATGDALLVLEPDAAEEEEEEDDDEDEDAEKSSSSSSDGSSPKARSRLAGGTPRAPRRRGRTIQAQQGNRMTVAENEKEKEIPNV